MRKKDIFITVGLSLCAAYVLADTHLLLDNSNGTITDYSLIGKKVIQKTENLDYPIVKNIMFTSNKKMKPTNP